MLWLSLGENCLADWVLQRHRLKSFATPFSHGRSNIDYILALEANAYRGVLDKAHLFKTVLADGMRVVKSNTYTFCDDIFAPGVSSMLEFTHHDVLDNPDHAFALQKRIQRLGDIKGKQDVCFFYHYRYSPKMDVPRIVEKLNKFAELYTSEQAVCLIALLFQKKIEGAERRELRILEPNGAVLPFEFRTQHIWGGNLVFPEQDDDLFVPMLSHLKDKKHDITDRR